MSREDKAQRLKSYLELITRKSGGPQADLEKLKATGSRAEEAVRGPLEAMPAGPSVAEQAQSGFEKLESQRAPSQGEMLGLEAIINEDLRPAIDVQNGTFAVQHPLWTRLSDDAAVKQRIEAVIPSVGRIELPGNTSYPYGGTGFVVGNGLLMTNRHVAEIFALGLGDRRLRFIDGARAGIDFLRERDRPTGPTLVVRNVVMIHPFWDMALLAVDGLPETRKPLKLSLKDARDLVGHDIFVVGYPAFDGRNPADVQQTLFEGRYGVKRLQPGQLQGGMKTASFGKVVPAATHDCSTLGGNSGSAVFDLDSGEVLALHFGGLYHQQNFCVPAFELARDDRVLAAGVSFAGAAPGGGHDWDSWWSRADATEAPVAGDGSARPATPSATAQAAAKATATAAAAVSTQGGAVAIEVPLRITISLGAPGAVAAATEAVLAPPADLLEAMREPFRDTDLTSRTGYDPNFLQTSGANDASVTVPLPHPKHGNVLARPREGGELLNYENFSVAMHAKRRLALFTASNVTKEPPLRRPDPNADYSRRGLSGLGPNDQERWFLDPRLDQQFQLPDVFFTKDRGSFDKGHIVRREDVAWGRTFDILRRANGDTYHVTNCSPQVADFNRSNLAESNWGDLENHVISEAASERLCLFAGPVLDAADEVFVGKGDGGVTLRAKIPSRFWKMIVARVDEGIAAFGFVLEQSLADVSFEEFAVPAAFVPAMTSVADIEAMTGVVFDQAIRDADQFETVRGGEVSMRAGVRRRRQG